MEEELQRASAFRSRPLKILSAGGLAVGCLFLVWHLILVYRGDSYPETASEGRPVASSRAISLALEELQLRGCEGGTYEGWSGEYVVYCGRFEDSRPRERLYSLDLKKLSILPGSVTRMNAAAMDRLRDVELFSSWKEVGWLDSLDLETAREIRLRLSLTEYGDSRQLPSDNSIRVRLAEEPCSFWIMWQLGPREGTAYYRLDLADSEQAEGEELAGRLTREEVEAIPSPQRSLLEHGGGFSCGALPEVQDRQASSGVPEGLLWTNTRSLPLGWEEAETFCGGLILEGRAWRLPTRFEVWTAPFEIEVTWTDQQDIAFVPTIGSRFFYYEGMASPTFCVTSSAGRQ